MSEPIVIGVGGNVGTDEEILARFQHARDLLERASKQRGARELRSAPLYRTAPVGPAQPPYLNTALVVELPLVPAALLATLLETEQQLGRTRAGERFGPRMIDLDILVWGDRVIETPGLVVPHPRLHQRRFALEPLVALVGDNFEIVGHGRAGTLLEAAHDQQVELVTSTW